MSKVESRKSKVEGENPQILIWAGRGVFYNAAYGFGLMGLVYAVAGFYGSEGASFICPSSEGA